MKRGMQYTTRMESMGAGVRPAPPSSSGVKNAQERPERGADIRKPLTARDAAASGDSGRDFDERAFLELARTSDKSGRVSPLPLAGRADAYAGDAVGPAADEADDEG